MKLPHAIRFFRKPDHISFLVGFTLLSSHLFINDFFLKITTILVFSFTLTYELFEISKGGRDIYKLDHFTFVIGFVLLIVTIMPYVIGMSGLIYLIIATGLGLYFLYYAMRMYREHENEELPMQMFWYSIKYLGYLFTALLVDHYFIFRI